eukprot:gene10779-10585_t
MALMHAQGEVARLSEREQLLSTLLVSVNAVLWAFNWETRQVLYVSPAYERLFGRSADLLLADYNQWRDSIYPDDLEYAERSLADVLVKGAVEDREYRIITADGQLRWLSDKCFINRQAEPGQPVIIVGIAEDITDKKQLESELQRLATTDALTSSSNRRHFFEGAEHEFEQARQQAALRRGDLFGRIGGEEFAAAFPGCTPEMALQVAERVQREIQGLTFNHEGQTFGITVSQGLTSLTAEDESVESLFARADAAMYEAKRQGKNRIITA